MLPKTYSKDNFVMPNDPCKGKLNLDEKWRFFQIPPILALFYGRIPKMAVSPERLNRFQKYLRSKSP